MALEAPALGVEGEAHGMPLLSKYREDYYFFSGKASEIARQLALAGLALVWLFKIDRPGETAIPAALFAPAGFLILAMFLDLCQYVGASLVWGLFSRSHERQGTPDDADITAPPWSNWPALIFFCSKVVAVAVGYVLLLLYVVAHIKLVPSP